MLVQTNVDSRVKRPDNNRVWGTDLLVQLVSNFRSGEVFSKNNRGY